MIGVLQLGNSSSVNCGPVIIRWY